MVAMAMYFYASRLTATAAKTPPQSANSNSSNSNNQTSSSSNNCSKRSQVPTATSATAAGQQPSVSSEKVPSTMSSEVDNRSTSVELMHQVFSELRAWSTSFENCSRFAALTSRRYTSMPNIAMQAAGDASSDIHHESAQTGSVDPSSGPNEVIVEKCAAPNHISLVGTEIMTPDAAELEVEAPSVCLPSDSSPSDSLVSDSPPSDSSPQQVWPAKAASQKVKSRCRVSSEAALKFDAEHKSNELLFGRIIPSGDLAESSALQGNGQTIEQTAAVHAASLLQHQTEGRPCGGTEPVTAVAKPKRRSIWKRTKRFFRRLLCCA